MMRNLIIVGFAMGLGMEPTPLLLAQEPKLMLSQSQSQSQPSPKQESDPVASELKTAYRPLEVLARSLYYLETMYVDPTKVDREKIIADAIKGVVSQLDPHTVYMPSKAFEQMTIDTQGKFGGVGVIISSERGRIIVISPIEDSPAFRAGIKTGDEVIAIDGKDVSAFPGGQATDAMRGDPESVLELTIKRKGVEEPLVFELIREIIKVKSVRAVNLGKDILYTRVSSFQDTSAHELEEILKANQSMKGMILDLRDNPGGLLDQAIKISDLFIDSGIIVSTVGRSKDEIEREFAHSQGTYSGFPMIVLINGGSASASEIVAGALQDHKRGLVMGTTSFGKGSVQTLVSLPDRSGLKITVARYYTPNDRSIQAKGIEPDIFVTKDKDTAMTTKKASKKESDLAGHIDSNDLSDMAQKSGMMTDTKSWPENLKSDYQLVTAFTYLRGWGLFNPKHNPSQGS